MNEHPQGDNGLANSIKPSGLDTVLDRFEHEWRHGLRPSIDDYLSTASDCDRRTLLLELVHLDLEARLRSGDAARVEEYLNRYPDLATDHTAVLGLIVSEYQMRRRREPGLSIDDYVSRFPSCSETLAKALGRPSPAAPERVKLRLECPHCQNPIEVIEDSREPDQICPSCGSSFRLDQDRTYTWKSENLPQLGKFELLEVVGKGSFGTVYRARDTELGRIVAVKVPRSGQLTSKEDEDRFIREARSVAQLQHANIVPVYETGRSTTFPFIVSKFVDGTTLSDQLTAKKLSFRKAAELIAAVADALEYAHVRGVIHRDVKPSNIMLEVDGSPHLMDFGLARRDAGEVTMTVEGQVLGTPAYMSPEQARGEGHRVDGRGDVYSLGVILYELLTGELPFRGNVRMLLHQVLHDEPRSLHSLNDRIPRDLETICLKAMAKEPNRRYATAADLSADLRRWLSGVPILARPIGTLERAWRWSQRNRVVASLSGAIALALIGGAVVSTYFALEARAQAQQALAERDRANDERRAADQAKADVEKALARAQREAETTARVSDFLVSLFRRSDLIGIDSAEAPEATQLTPEATIRDVFEASAKQLQRSQGLDPLIEAKLWDTIGVVDMSLGLMTEADAILADALDVRRRHLPPNDVDLAASLAHYGTSRFVLGYYDDGEPLLREAIRIYEQQGEADSLKAANAEAALAWLLTERKRRDDEGDLKEAAARIHHVGEIRRKHHGKSHREVAFAVLIEAYIAHTDKRVADAVRLMAEGVAILGRVEGAEFVNAALKNLTKAVTARSFGNGEIYTHHAKEALVDLRRALGGHNPVVSILTIMMAQHATDLKQFAAAHEFFREVEPVVRRMYGSHPMIFEFLVRKAYFLHSSNRSREFLATATEAIDVGRRFLGNRKYTFAKLLNDTGVTLASQGKHDEAIDLFRESLSAWTAKYGEQDENTAMVLENWGDALCDKHEYTEAEKLFRRSLAIRRNLNGTKPLLVADSLDRLADLAEKRRAHDECLALSRESLDIARNALKGDRRRLAVRLHRHAKHLEKAGRLDESLQFSREDLGLVQAAGLGISSDAATTWSQLARVHTKKKDFGEAARCHGEALRIRMQLFGKNAGPWAVSAIAELRKDAIYFKIIEIGLRFGQYAQTGTLDVDLGRVRRLLTLGIELFQSSSKLAGAYQAMQRAYAGPST